MINDKNIHGIIFIRGYMDILADKLRPNKLSEVVGQEHLIGKDKIIYNLIHNKKIVSMILYGRPGTGKTTLGI